MHNYVYAIISQDVVRIQDLDLQTFKLMHTIENCVLTHLNAHNSGMVSLI